MIELLKKLLLPLAGMLLVSFGLFSCTSPVSQTTIIEGIIYPREVCASFEALIAYRPADTVDGPLKYKWTADNGTIKGEGQSIIWVPPDIPGKYSIAVKITDSNGSENVSQVILDVVAFTVTDVVTSPDIVLQIHSDNNTSISERICMSPAVTAEIRCFAPDISDGKYTYSWSCNGGKLVGPGLREGIADKVGWTSPGMAGYYTVKVVRTDSLGNISIGNVYVFVRPPHCCETPNDGSLIQWKK